MYSFFLISLLLPQIIVGFSPGLVLLQQHSRVVKQSSTSILKAASSRARYGPSDNDQNDIDTPEEQAVIQEEHINRFRSLIQNLLVAELQEVHTLIATHVDFFLSSKPSILSQSDVLESIVNESPTHEQEKVMAIIEYISSFMEEFVEETVAMDKDYKELLGKILKIMCGENTDDDNDDIYKIKVKKSASSREEELDDFMASNTFTPGFLRHLEGECERIENAPRTTSESLRLLQVLRTIRIRVIEELGTSLGEGASVLGQLLAYDDAKERLAVLQTGLELRGIDFALEMLKLTEEALGQMKTLDPTAVDPDLVARLKAINIGIQTFVTSSMKS